ncbi:hypothetical protein HFU84_10800 [Acidithiobacillus sp. CV18-2]|nr:hypothetical protein [Acidithiobacillus sp. CV18-3]MBU2756918.1 hypothetical protein [Acidithiobacillus sp. BN09-2]MBU2777984.1 hypothetical protein [Acidithiobacillus sp. CV18-2]MBU2799629.1 hypothetical protein [Acidithiobacillus sp. VAN18-4]
MGDRVDDRTSGQPERKADTERLYGRLVRRILERSAREGVETLGDLGVWLRDQAWSASTLRLYRMALLWYLVDVGQQGTREEVGRVLGMDGARKVRRKTGPGKRRKSEKGWAEVSEWLRGRNVRAAADTALWMSGAMRLGIRPVEWWDTAVDREVPGRVWIPTAKVKRDAHGRRVRGAGQEDATGRVWRCLDFALDADGCSADWSVVVAMLAMRDGYRAEGDTAEAVLACFAQWLRRGWDAVHGRKRPRITLYTARHVFAGRLKAKGMDRWRIAAAMGQMSEKSSKVYGRAQHSGGGLQPARGLQPAVVNPVVHPVVTREPTGR